MLKTPIMNTVVSSWSDNTMQTANLLHVPKVNNCCSSSESTPGARHVGESNGQGNNSRALRVLPDFTQVYFFIGRVFDPNITGHLQKLKKMDPIDVETRRLLSSYEAEPEIDSYINAERPMHGEQLKSAT